MTIDDHLLIDDERDLDAFAIRDGFQAPARFGLSSWAYMSEWWAHTHPGTPIFNGVLVVWGESFEPFATTPIERAIEAAQRAIEAAQHVA